MGMGAIVLQRARLGAGAMLAAGAVLVRALGDRRRDARRGVPAREKKPLSGSAQALDADRGRRVPALPPALPDRQRRHRRELTMEAAMLIGGEWRQAASSEEIEVVNPATEEVGGQRPQRRGRRRRAGGGDRQGAPSRRGPPPTSSSARTS